MPPVDNQPPQPQPPTTPDPIPTQPQPTVPPSDPIQPSPQPIMPAPAPEAPAPVMPPTPVQPVPPTAASPQVVPAPDPGMAVPQPTVAAAPVVNDPTQPGYTPPATPAGLPPMMGANGMKAPGSKARLIRIVLAVVIALVVLSGGGLLLKDTLFSGSNIKVGDLVSDSAEGVSFKRPKNWTEVSDADFDGKVYTEDGASTDDTDQALFVGSDSLPLDYDTLSDAQKQSVFKSFEGEYSSSSAFESDSCKEASTPKVTKISQRNYTDAFQIEVTCEKFSKRNLKAQLKAVYGLKGEKVDLVMIVAVDKTWDKSGDALNEILTSFKPAE